MDFFREKGIKEALFAVLLWSTVATAFKLTLQHIGPLELLLISSSFSLLVLYIAQRKRKECKKVTPLRPIWFYMLLGFLNPFLYYNLLFEAYNRLYAHEALILNYTWPIALGVTSSVFFKRGFKKSTILSLLLGFIGVVFVVTKGNFKELRFESPLGILFALLSAWVWSLFWTLSMMDESRPVETLYRSFLFGVPLVYILWIIVGERPSLNLNGLVGGIYVGLFEMSLTFILWLTALGKTRRISVVLNMAYLIPFLSMGIISLFLHERMSLFSFLGFLFVIVAVYISRGEKGVREGDKG